MSEEYPHKCCRCGLCCLSTTCVVGMKLFKIDAKTPCPALSFFGNVATCSIAKSFVPVGDGCCMKGRVYRNGVKFDFAPLPNTFKYVAAQQVRRRQYDKITA